MIKYTILYFQTGPQFFTAAFLEYIDGGGGGFERHLYRSISRTYIGNSEIFTIIL